MKVLVADKFSELGMNEMMTSGLDVSYDAALQGEALAAKLAEVQPQVLVVRSTKVTVPVIDANKNL